MNERVVKLIEISPDELIEMGARMKRLAMESCYPGESVLINLTPSVILLYKPEKEFLKPKPQTFEAPHETIQN